MRRVEIAVIIALFAGLGCGMMSTGSESDIERKPTRTVDGLVHVQIDAPGVLFLRHDHRIGSYDALQIKPAWISYKRGSRRLATDMEEEFKQQLVQSLAELARAAAIPLVDSPGACVMAIEVGLLHLDLERSSYSESMGRLTLAMEFRDSESGDPLLRYATRNRIENPGEGVTRRRQLRESFKAMLDRMNLSVSLRGAGLADDEIRPPCQGTLAQRGRQAREAAGQR
ncbi:MAG: hypothetical protein JRF61_10675 [Deltaproteobacteria bacterium]|jgi:hypothetical protein|nr:hypothetical protein [Deltaproteobacteria bacterium]